MAYTIINFKTKKALKEAVAKYIDNLYKFDFPIWEDLNQPIRCFQQGLEPDLSNYTGTVSLEGPHAPASHTWYAQAELKNGIVVKVK